MKYDFYALFKPTEKDYEEMDKRYKRFCEKNGYEFTPYKREPLYKEKTLPDGTKIREKVKQNEARRSNKTNRKLNKR